jgi:hypothetical protein
VKEEQDKQKDLDWFATPTLPLTGPLSEFVRTASIAGPKTVSGQGENQRPEKQVDDSSMSKENLPVNEHPTKQQEVVSTATSKVLPQPTPIKANAVASAQQATTEDQPHPALLPLSRKQEKKAKKKAAKAQREALAQMAALSAVVDTTTTTPLPQIQPRNPPARPGANLQVVKLGVSAASLDAYIGCLNGRTGIATY